MFLYILAARSCPYNRVKVLIFGNPLFCQRRGVGPPKFVGPSPLSFLCLALSQTKHYSSRCTLPFATPADVRITLAHKKCPATESSSPFLYQLVGDGFVQLRVGCVDELPY